MLNHEHPLFSTAVAAVYWFGALVHLGANYVASSAGAEKEFTEVTG